MKIKTLLRIIRRASLAALSPYRVRILGGACDGTEHSAMTYRAALEWAACYPAHTCLEVHIWAARGRRWAGRVI